MNKNIQLALGVFVIFAIGMAVYITSTPSTDTTTPVATTTNKPKNTPKNEIEKVTPASASTMPTIPKNDTTVYNCKDGKSVSIKYSFTGIATTTVILSDTTGKRTLDFTPKESKVDPTFQSANGKITIISKGNYVLVKEEGKTTFDECKFPQ